MGNKIVTISVVISLLAALVFIVWPKQSVVSKDNFGDCLAQSDITMYGSDTCGSCIAQKEILGKYFASVKYVNCAFNSSECREKGIRGVPTWIIGEKFLPGRKTIAEIEELTGCNLTKIQ